MAKIYLKRVETCSLCYDDEGNPCYFNKEDACIKPAGNTAGRLSCTMPDDIVFIQVSSPKED